MSHFILTVLGFSAWFFMVVPFATHRESYTWLAGVRNQGFAEAFSFISVTYRPLAQSTTWLGFRLLDPHIFPTSVWRQTLLQGFVYALFVFAWYLIYRAADQPRLLALVALVAGGVFFPGYVHMFHIYGLFYVPVLLMIGVLLLFHISRAVDRRELWLGAGAFLLVFWHPFATALFLGYFAGFYLETFRRRNLAEHIRAIGVGVACAAAIFLMVGVFVRSDVNVPFHTKLLGFLVTYQTSEINVSASLVALLLTLLVVWSMNLTPAVKITASIASAGLGIVFLLYSVPILLLWLCAVLAKLYRLRCWSLFFLTFAAVLLPIGAVIGSPVFGLFAIVIGTFVTSLGWSEGERSLSFLTTRFVVGIAAVAAAVVVLVRIGVEVPIVTRAATPLLVERERTYQLENVLDWLHKSSYCAAEVDFANKAGSPIDSVENVLTRKNRPPASIDDVRFFWDSVLRCDPGHQARNNGATAIITFDGPQIADSSPAFTVKGAYAGDATVWIREPTKIAGSDVKAGANRVQ